MYTSKSLGLSDHSNNDDFHHDKFTQFDQYFPWRLRHNLDIAIINDEADEDDAHNLKDVIRQNVQLKIDGKHFRPKVELLKHVSPSMHVDPIDYALEEAVCLIVYVTHNYLENELCKFESRSSVKAILSGKKPCSLVCVHKDQSTSNRLGTHLDHVKQLYYCKEKQEQFIEDVTTYFYQISDTLLTKKRELTQLRGEYYEKHLAHTIKQESSSNKGKFSQRKTNVAEMDKSSQHDQVHQQLASPRENNTVMGKQTAHAHVVDRESGTHKRVLHCHCLKPSLNFVSSINVGSSST